MKKQHRTILAHRLPPLRDFTLSGLLQLSKRCGAQVETRYHPRHREFLVYTRSKKAQTKLGQLLQAFPEQKIRI